MTKKNLKKAVFLDRDGTIIQDAGYISSTSDVEFFADTFPVLRQLQEEFELFVVTNQSGVGKGLITLEEAGHINSYIDERLRSEGINIREWFVCPHRREDGCLCMKPEPHFLFEAAEKYGVKLSRSWVIGDHPHDMDFAENGGAEGLYLLTGHGYRHVDELSPDVPVFHTLTDAAEEILKSAGKKASIFCTIDEAAKYIKKGGIAAFPTETVYGLGGDAFNPEAAARIFELKKRPLFNPLIAHIADMDQLDRLASEISGTALKLIEAFWPGPLTLVFKKRSHVPDIVTGGNPTVAVRMPSHPMALELIKKADSPLAAPSANAFGKTSPTTASHVIEQLGRDGYKIIDGGACRVGVESTVLSLVHEKPLLLRPGGLSVEDLEKVIGPVEQALAPGAALKDIESPGMLASHYSPRTPLILADEAPAENSDPETGLMLFKPAPLKSAGPVEILSPSGSTEEAAVNLYAAMRRLDRQNLKQIIAYRLPEEGLGRAVNDRITKAAAGS